MSQNEFIPPSEGDVIAVIQFNSPYSAPITRNTGFMGISVIHFSIFYPIVLGCMIFSDFLTWMKSTKSIFGLLFILVIPFSAHIIFRAFFHCNYLYNKRHILRTQSKIYFYKNKLRCQENFSPICFNDLSLHIDKQKMRITHYDYDGMVEYKLVERFQGENSERLFQFLRKEEELETGKDLSFHYYESPYV